MLYAACSWLQQQFALKIVLFNSTRIPNLFSLHSPGLLEHGEQQTVHIFQNIGFSFWIYSWKHETVSIFPMWNIELLVVLFSSYTLHILRSNVVWLMFSVCQYIQLTVHTSNIYAAINMRFMYFVCNESNQINEYFFSSSLSVALYSFSLSLSRHFTLRYFWFELLDWVYILVYRAVWCFKQINNSHFQCIFDFAFNEKKRETHEKKLISQQQLPKVVSIICKVSLFSQCEIHILI